MPSKMNEPKKLIANNKKAFFDYFIEDTLEVGIELAGTEVKSVRAGKVSIKEAYVSAQNGQLVIYGMNITPYEKGNIFRADVRSDSRFNRFFKNRSLVIFHRCV